MAGKSWERVVFHCVFRHFLVLQGVQQDLCSGKSSERVVLQEFLQEPCKNPQESCKKPARIKNFLQIFLVFLNFLAGHFVGSCRKMLFFFRISCRISCFGFVVSCKKNWSLRIVDQALAQIGNVQQIIFGIHCYEILRTYVTLHYNMFQIFPAKIR